MQYPLPLSDLGVFIGAMDENGFAFKSGKLQFNDRILACNGVDFTKEHTMEQVKDIFYQMTQQPLLRMAISRGVTLPDVDDSRAADDHVTREDGHMTGQDSQREDVPVGGGGGRSGIISCPSSAPTATSGSASVGGASVEEGRAKGSSTRGESAPEPPKSPRIRKSGRNPISVVADFTD